MGLAAVSLPYYRHIYSYGLEKFARFATEIWGVSPEGKSSDEIARAGLDTMEEFLKECPDRHVPLKSSVPRKRCSPRLQSRPSSWKNGYKKLTTEEILSILEECFLA